ncbi:MAG: hypothetical protein ACRYFX_17730 [Janthinobacterium lividum]
MSSDNGYIYRINTPNTASYSSSTTSFTGYYVGTGVKGADANVDGARCIASAVSPLPVELTSFTATAAPSRRVQLTWTTASELTNDHFEVQRSPDGHTFAAVGQVPGHGTTPQASTYSFVDAAPGSAASTYYRLRQVNTDGSFDFGPVRVVTLAAGTSSVLLRVAPNPTSPAGLRVQVQYGGSAAAPATLTLRDLLGRPVLTQPVTLAPGTNALAPTGVALAPGTYWLSLSGEAAAGTPGVRVVVAQ